MKNLKLILVGMLCSTIFSVICLLLFSAFLMKSNINELYVPTIIIILFSLSIFCGTIISTKKIKKNGAIYGIAISLGYLAIMYIISSTIIKDYTLTKQSIIMILSVIMIGSFGGIIGVNIK